MGGFGSGWHRGGRREVEDVRSVDVRRWHRDGLLEGRDDAGAVTRHRWRWTDAAGRPTASITFDTRPDDVTLLYRQTSRERATDIRQRVALAWMPLHFGGARPWFVCPLCRRRVALLYLLNPPACRHCHRLSYRSRNQTDTDRGIDQCHKLQERHGGQHGALGELGPRPKGMHRTTWARIEARHERSRRRALATMAHRLGVRL